MSNVLDRPRTSSASRSRNVEPASSVWVRGAIAAAWAVVVAVAALIVLSLVVWAADSKSTAGAGGAMKFAVQLWLLAHRVPLRVPNGGAIAIPPFALTLIIGALIARGAAIMARSAEINDVRDIGVITASVTAPYAVMATLLAVVTPSSSLRPSIAAALLSSAVIAAIASTFGAVRGARLARPTWEAMTTPTRGALSGAAAAACVMFGAATLLAIGSVLSHIHEFGSVAGDYNGGSGQFAMVAISILMIPNAICFGIGYMTGPGFAIGTGTSVTYTSVHLGAVPAFPLLAAVPSGAAPWQIMVIFVAGVVGAGVAAGFKIAALAELNLREQVRAAAIAGGLFGVVVAAIVGFAGGPAGPGRLGSVGPSPWQVGFASAAEIAVVAMIVVAVRYALTALRR